MVYLSRVVMVLFVVFFLFRFLSLLSLWSLEPSETRPPLSTMYIPPTLASLCERQMPNANTYTGCTAPASLIGGCY